jgi:hypothetical protein
MLFCAEKFLVSRCRRQCMEPPTDDETSCEFVSSRGILKSCDRHNPIPQSSSDFLDPAVYSNLPKGSTVYVCTEAIPNFVKTYLPQAQGPITVISGDSDLSFTGPAPFLDHPNIKHWWAQNCVFQHPRLSPIPIGLDYHTVANQDHHWGPKMTPKDQEKQLKSLAALVPNWHSREQRAYANYLLNISRGNRQAALQETAKDLVIYETQFVPRQITWWKQASAVFTISPHGNGLDCHRTWETLALGGIPIVQTSVLDSLYEGLPVLIVSKWSDLTEDLLEQTIRAFQQRSFNRERLTLKYWISKIKETKE